MDEAGGENMKPMTAHDWSVVDSTVQLLRVRPDVWMFDIQDVLRQEGVTHPRAFAQVCDTLRNHGVRINNSID
jgi:spore germination cell wall hydrolase CwlJ-like protein